MVLVKTDVKRDLDPEIVEKTRGPRRLKRDSIASTGHRRRTIEKGEDGKETNLSR